jgi:hypothetical protein
MTDGLNDGRSPWQGSLLLWQCAWPIGTRAEAIADEVQYCRVQGLVEMMVWHG